MKGMMKSMLGRHWAHMATMSFGAWALAEYGDWWGRIAAALLCGYMFVTGWVGGVCDEVHGRSGL